MTGGSNISFKSLIIILPVITLLISCGPGNHYSEIRQVPDSIWNSTNRISFDAPITDTVSPFDILFSIRNSPEYPYRNIFLFVTTVSPNGYMIKDTIEYQLADEKGNWYGHGLGDIHDLSVPFKQNVVFPVSGTYSFRIQQGMRTDDLRGIRDIGIRIRHRK